MKLRYFIPAFVAALTMFASCSDDNDPTYLDEVRLSTSYVAIDENGGSTTITLKATNAWAFEKNFQQIIKNEDGTRDTIYTETPEWLSVSQTSGVAGETQLTFSADKAADGRSAELRMDCGDKTQIINVIQGLATVSNATCAEVIAGPDSKTYRVTGTCTAIANTTYGNWYLTDETGQIYIYGTLDAKGQTKNFLSLGLEVGDVVTVEGPKTTYGTTVELMDVTVVKIQKSLIKVDSLSIADGTLPKEGGNITANLSCKGNGVSVVIPEEAQSWLSMTAITSGSNPTVTFRAAANDGGARSATVTFKTTDGEKEYTSEATINQLGDITEVTAAEFLEAPVSDAQYRITGMITKVAKAEYGNIYVRDYSGEIYVYGVGAKGDFEKLGLKEGDIVTLVGKRGEYKGAAQMTGAAYESSISVQEVSLAEFLTKEDSKEVYYKVTGTIDEIANDTYGNLYLKDGDTRLYVYGCYPGWGATGDARKNLIATLGIEVGDKLTVVGPKSTYKDVPQVNGGLYFSHEKPQ
ncbi:MAG: DNA-binding protein [Prevotella sp.]|nr:DNA-binding protein [Prevotella sp.]